MLPGSHHERASRCQVGGCTWGGTRMGYNGWVIGGVYRVPSHAARGEVLMTAKRARKPCRGWSGGHEELGRPSSPGTTLRARSVPCRPLPVPGLPSPGKAASGPIRARLRLIFLKVSQNDEVSPKIHEKASHSPYSQNGSRNSPLGILRFPVSPAFSDKELMVPF